MRLTFDIDEAEDLDGLIVLALAPAMLAVPPAP